MRVLGAIEFAPGHTNVERIRHVAGLVFTDEYDRRFQFTWRTIQTLRPTANSGSTLVDAR